MTASSASIPTQPPTSSTFNSAASTPPFKFAFLMPWGQEMYEMQVDATLQVETLRIPVAAWPTGVYSVQIQSGGRVLTRQVAVQRR
ncbi:MAG: hypothetical protein SGI94_11200 [Saprospiraceae bacterium]|nr:hypothetical protein [Saprospiraceae bacterium]